VRRIILYLIIVLLCAWGWVTYSNHPKVIMNRLDIADITLGKGSLHYRLYAFGLLPVGDAVMYTPVSEDFKGVAVHHLRARATTLPYLKFIISGLVELDSYVDLKTLNPLLFRQRFFVKNKTDSLKEAWYDQQAGEMTLKGVRRQILPDTQDHLSAIYRLRRSNLSALKEFDMNINTNQKNYSLKGSVQETQAISVRGKSYALLTLQAQVSRRDKNPYHRSRMSMVMLKDKSNLPILIKVFASGGIIHARLIAVGKK